VSHLWTYDYKTAEKRVFKAKQVWDPTRLPVELVDQYLQALSFNWGPKTGLIEECALSYLA